MLEHLNIEGNNSIISHAEDNLIEYMYNLSKSLPGSTYQYMKGRLEVLHGYMDAINFLTGKFQDLYIVSTDSPYIRFIDSAVQSKLANRIGDGESVTLAQANALSNQSILKTIFTGDSNIVSFNELGQYFKNISALDAETFKNCTSLESIDLQNISGGLGSNIFNNCTSLTTVTGLENIEYVGYSTFGGCTSLVRLNFSNKLKSFNKWSFNGCSNLETISNETIYPTRFNDEGAFRYCTKFTGPIDLSLCTQLYKNTFENTPALKSVGSLNTSISVIPYKCFNACGITSLGGLDNIIDVNESALSYCTGLTSLNFTNKLKYIRKYAFINDTNLTSISQATIYPLIVGESAFNNCRKFNGSLNLSLCETLETGAFMETWALQSITIDSPDITVLADVLFKNSGIQTINGLQYITTVSNECFKSCKSLISLNFTSNLTSIKTYAFCGCENLETISNETIYPTTLEEAAFSNCKSFTGTSLNLSNLSTVIAQAFINCTSLSTMDGLENITTVGREAFKNCPALKHLNFSDKLTSIGWDAFRGCSNLETLIDNGYIYPTSIGPLAFGSCSKLIGPFDLTYCTDLAETAFAGAGPLKINIGPNLTSLPWRLFDGSALKEIYIPSNITTISGLVFGYTSNLEEVTMQSSTPPTLGNDEVFKSSNSNRRIYVPVSAVETYKAATYWSNQASYIYPVYDAQVEYIEVTGTQWIDTEITPTESTYSQIKFNHLTNDSKVIYGFILDDDSHSRGYIDYRYMHYANNTYFDIHGVTDNGQRCQANGASQQNAILEIELGNHYIKNIATNTVLASTRTMAEEDIPTRGTIKLGYNEKDDSISNCRWYYVKIYDNNNLILDLIPVRRGAVGMMYDRVSGKVFKNKGTGNFVIGNDI